MLSDRRSALKALLVAPFVVPVMVSAAATSDELRFDVRYMHVSVVVTLQDLKVHEDRPFKFLGPEGLSPEDFD